MRTLDRRSLAAFLRSRVAACEHGAYFFPHDGAVLLVARGKVVLLAEIRKPHRVERHRQPQRRALLDRVQHANRIAQVDQAQHFDRKVADDEKLHVHRHRNEMQVSRRHVCPRRHGTDVAIALQMCC
jgi:hypothetical protein